MHACRGPYEHYGAFAPVPFRVRFRVMIEKNLRRLNHVHTSLLFSGVRYPKLAATLGAGWMIGTLTKVRGDFCVELASIMIGRVLYTIGYLSGEPKRVNSTLV
jgi:hypothetical protein